MSRKEFMKNEYPGIVGRWTQLGLIIGILSCGFYGREAVVTMTFVGAFVGIVLGITGLLLAGRDKERGGQES